MPRLSGFAEHVRIDVAVYLHLADRHFSETAYRNDIRKNISARYGFVFVKADIDCAIDCSEDAACVVGSATVAGCDIYAPAPAGFFNDILTFHINRVGDGFDIGESGS